MSDEPQDFIASLGASYQPCRRHPEHSVFTDAQGRQATHNCPGCKLYTEYKGKREAWEYASDYHFDGKTVSYDSTRGRVETYTFGPSEKFK